MSTKGELAIWEAILKALEGKEDGDTFSLLHVTDMVVGYRGKRVTDGSVSRRLREFNAGKYDVMSGVVLRWDVVTDGVYVITRLEEYPKISAQPVVYNPAPERLSPVLPPAGGDGEYKLF